MDFESAMDLFWTITVLSVAVAVLVPLAAGVVVGVRALLGARDRKNLLRGGATEKYGR